jgi:anti-sigma regulatory factor (Ser/Thr protein kinase)
VGEGVTVPTTDAVAETHRGLRLSLTVRPAELGTIRRTVIRALDAWGFGELAGDTALVVGELLANVHEHAGGRCDLEVAAGTDRVTVRVSDGERLPPRPRPRSDTAEAGRGLLLISALAESWHTSVTATGKIVTCTLRRVP